MCERTCSNGLSVGGEREKKRLQKGDFVKNNGHATTSQRENGNNTASLSGLRDLEKLGGVLQ